MPAELTPDLYRMSMWQVDRWCQRHPRIDRDEVVSAVHERLTLALQTYDPLNPRAKLTSWLARATWNGISSAIQNASRQKRQAIRMSDIVSEDRPVDTIPALSCASNTCETVMLKDILRKRLPMLSPRQKEVFMRVIVNGERYCDFNETRSKCQAAILSKDDALFKLRTGLQPANGVH